VATDLYPRVFVRPDGATAIALSPRDEAAYVAQGCERVPPPPPLASGFPKRLVNPDGKSVVVGTPDQEQVWLTHGFICIESARS
jgi:hypothetical protein